MFTAQNLYGTTPQAPSYAVAQPTQAMGIGPSDMASGVRGLLDPRNPLLWFGAILAVTVGAASVAGSVRLGPGKISAQLGKD